MHFYRSLFLAFSLCLFWISADAKLPDISPKETQEKINEIMKSHATYKELNPILIKRILNTYLEELDPNKTYFIETDIHQWTDPSDTLVNSVLYDMQHGNYAVFDQMQKALIAAIKRRRDLEKAIPKDLPKNVKATEFKDMKWVKNEDELVTRLTRIKALQAEAAAKLNEDTREKSLQRIEKRKTKFEEEMLTSDQKELQQRILTMVLKAVAASLDSHTAYFTPDEATQFMINVQQRLFGIGAQLRDDISGFSVVKIIEGGPAAGSELKVKDKIIAVNGEPVVGMDIEDAVELIRGEKDTPVTLTVIREVSEGEAKVTQKMDITLKRGEVVLKESRYESTFEPYGDGAIGYLRLYSFYQDPESSSASDLTDAIRKLKEKHNLKGLILDLRYNSGGMLSQAVAVTGLFITKGTVVSIKDENGAIQHLRDLDGKTLWDGPLIVLINRASASASEIVAQTLQDYGRALIIGDDHSFGKGSFQTFTLNTTQDGGVNPQGEYKVTRGRYYTVSGNTPQLAGVKSDIVVPGPLSETEIGEKFSKFPLENDKIKENYDDDLLDIPSNQRDKIKILYKFDLQKKLHTYDAYLPSLSKNSSERIQNNKIYQAYLKELKKKEEEEEEDESEEKIGQNDLQLAEAFNIMKDLIFLTNCIKK